MDLKNKRNLVGVFALLALWLLAIDRTTKSWAADALALGVPGGSLGPIDLTLVHNTGAAFGVGQGNGLVFVGMAAVIVVAIVVWLLKSDDCSALEMIGLASVAAGGIGNMIDRLTTGYVVDFLEFNFVRFPVFNVADICVTVGVVLVIFSLISRFKEVKGEVDAELADKLAAEKAKQRQQTEELRKVADQPSAPVKQDGGKEAVDPQPAAKKRKWYEPEPEPEVPLTAEDLEWEREVAAYEARVKQEAEHNEGQGA